MTADMDPHHGDSDRLFEPLGRCRAFTWHGNLNDYSGSDYSTRSDLAVVVKSESHTTGGQKDDVLNLKKPSTRRNAWGCMSYADLITKAIESVPEKRLTLSQIYAWMIQNVPYFKDKGESNSSAGWKNSVRHNLSLHRKFVRVQNEGTGKSSWWIINNEVKSCKSPRRRAASFDNKNYEKKRRQTTLPQNVQEQTSVTGNTQSNVSASPEVQRLDSFAAAFSPIDLRSNGKAVALKPSLLSPIEPIPESAFDDQVMTQPSPLYWNQCHSVNTPYVQTAGLTETVGENLAELFTPDVNTNYEPSFSPDRQLTVLQNVNNEQYVSDSSYPSFQDLGGTLPLLPPYAERPASSESSFPQVSAKDLLQSFALSNQMDMFSGVQYLSRSEFSMNQDLQGDTLSVPKYYPERNEGELRGNSVLRQMLMQTPQKSNSVSEHVAHHFEPVVKSESVTAAADAFSYYDVLSYPSEAVFPGKSTVSNIKQVQNCELDYRESPHYAVKIEQDADIQIFKQEDRKEACNLNTTSSKTYVQDS